MQVILQIVWEQNLSCRPALWVGPDTCSSCSRRYGHHSKQGQAITFITFTCNPAWAEITRELLSGQDAKDRWESWEVAHIVCDVLRCPQTVIVFRCHIGCHTRSSGLDTACAAQCQVLRSVVLIWDLMSCRPDLTSRFLFKLKLDELLADLTKRHILGHVTGYVYTVEFQKRGLPHAHILMIMHPDDRPRTAADFDAVVCADAQACPELYETASKCMMHGPCGAHDAQAPCMTDGSCSKNFPKPF